jgi:hypothetical protein
VHVPGQEQPPYEAIETEFGSGLSDGLPEIGVDRHDPYALHELDDGCLRSIDRFLQFGTV